MERASRLPRVSRGLRLIFLNLVATASSWGNGVLNVGLDAASGGSGGAFAGTGGSLLGAAINNPAALSQLEEGGWSLSWATLYGSGEFQRGPERSDLEGAFGILPQAGIVWHLPERAIWMGASLSPLAALTADWDYEDVSGGLGGANYGNVSHRSGFLAIEGRLAVAWQPTTNWSFGAHLGMVYSRVDFDAPFIFQTNPTWQGAKVDLDLATDGFSPRFGAGLLYTPHQDWRFGLRFESGSVLRNGGDARVDYSAQLDALGLSAADARDSYQAETRNELPLVIGGGVSWQATERLKLGSWVDWIAWSNAFDTFNVRLNGGSNAELEALFGNDLVDEVPLDWEDRFVVSLGAEFAIAEQTTLRAGWRYGRAPVPGNLVTPLNGSILEQSLHLGAGWHRGDWQWDLAYSYHFGGEAKVTESGYRAGEYSNSALDVQVHELAVSLSYLF